MHLCVYSPESVSIYLSDGEISWQFLVGHGWSILTRNWRLQHCVNCLSKYWSPRYRLIIYNALMTYIYPKITTLAIGHSLLWQTKFICRASKKTQTWSDPILMGKTQFDYVSSPVKANSYKLGWSRVWDFWNPLQICPTIWNYYTTLK